MNNNNNNNINMINESILCFDSRIDLLKNEIHNLNSTYPEEVSLIYPTDQLGPLPKELTLGEQVDFVEDLFSYLRLTRNSIVNEGNPKSKNFYDPCPKCRYRPCKIKLKHPMSDHSNYSDRVDPESPSSHVFAYLRGFDDFDNKSPNEIMTKFQRKMSIYLNKFTQFNKFEDKWVIEESTSNNEIQHYNQFFRFPHVHYPRIKKFDILVYDQSIRVLFSNLYFAGLRGIKDPIYSSFNEFKYDYIKELMNQSIISIHLSLQEIKDRLKSDFPKSSVPIEDPSTEIDFDLSIFLFNDDNNDILNEIDPDVLALDQYLENCYYGDNSNFINHDNNGFVNNNNDIINDNNDIINDNDNIEIHFDLLEIIEQD
ncbi:expressed protein [Dictyostelium purpureum]|uniref:Expressed protein n=1 Tax=Dictyostelium purpureum TaxID=5786 RepID=F0ZU84_DICPU|nr:uncharacterized protein DICPUDRAFT_92587 [Dictyostelium purpureum]EGC32481.1 expressed protein [Dictyostelium purpureum]|eukprot:XP_003290974.1 expressed protein [Dictyostelium purpureum]